MSLAGKNMSQSYVAQWVILPRWINIQNVLGTLFMLYSHVASHLRARGELLLSGQFDRMIAGYNFPLPIFLHSSRLVIHTPDQAAVVFSQLRDALSERGVVALRPSIAALDLPRAGRFRVWVDWQQIAFAAESTRISQVVYYFRDTDLGLRTEMLNYTHLSMPELDQQFAALALSA
jgi:hypothetical protein